MIHLIFFSLSIINFGFVISSSYLNLSKVDENFGKKRKIFIYDKSAEIEHWPFGFKRVLTEPGATVTTTLPPFQVFDVDLSDKKSKLLSYQKIGLPYKPPMPDFDDPHVFDSVDLSIPFENDENTEFLKFSIHSTHDEIIEKELQSCRFKQQRLDAYRKILNLISANDRRAFIEYEDEFSKRFKIKSTSHVTKGDFENRLIIFVILFGATEIADRFSYTLKVSSQLNFDIFRYLIETKSLEVTLGTIFGCDARLSTQYAKGIIKRIEQKNPNLGYFPKKAFKFFELERSFYQHPWNPFFVKGTEFEIFVAIFDYLEKNYVRGMVLNFFAEIIYERRDLFLQCNFKTRFELTLCAIKADRSDILQSLLELDNNLSKFELLNSIVFNSSANCFRYILSTDNSLLNTKSNAPIFGMLIKDVYLLAIIYDFGYDYNIEIIDKETEPSFNLIQYAFYKNCASCLKHLVEKYGKKIVAENIVARWGTAKEQLIQSIAFNPNIQLMEFCRDILDVNLSATYQFNGKRGDALIFSQGLNRSLTKDLKGMGLTGSKKNGTAVPSAIPS